LKNTTNPENIIVLDSLPYSPVRISLEAESSDSFCPGYFTDYVLNYYKNPEADFLADPTFGHPPFTAFFMMIRREMEARNSFMNGILEMEKPEQEITLLLITPKNGSYDVKLKIKTHANCLDSIIKKRLCFGRSCFS
jgi:hypothetical protein